MSFDFFPNEQQGNLLDAARRPSLAPDPGTFTNFLPGAATYGMRSLAEVGRAIDLAGSIFPIVHDAVVGGTENQDQYFREHDEVFNNAVDYWTPKPGEVGTAGQVAGQLAGGVLQAAISPALLVGTSHLATAEDLNRQGVDASVANAAGAIAGLGTAAGLKMPYLGKTLASRLMSGAIGNTVQGAATAAATRAVLNAAGNTEQAAQYDPTEVRGRVLDALLGAAFGGLAHIDAKAQERMAAKLTPSDQAALLVTNDARHLEETSAPGRPITQDDLTKHVDAIREAIDQTLRGDAVAVDRTTLDMRMARDPVAEASRAEVHDEIVKLAGEEAPPVPQSEQQAQPAWPDAVEQVTHPDLSTARAHAALLENPDLMIPTGHTDADGNPVSLRAADVLTAADGQVTQARATAGELFRTAAACLTGVL